MTDQSKQAKKDQYWMIGITLLVLILTTATANVLMGEDYNPLWAGVFGGLGGGLGAGIYYLIKNWSTRGKALTMGGIFMLWGLIVPRFLVDQVAQDAENWPVQTIGALTFSSPEALQLQVDEVPPEAQAFYKKMEIYTDGNNERSTSCINIVLQNDSLDEGRAFEGALSGILRNIQVDMKDVVFDTLLEVAGERALTFTFPTNRGTFKGYGYMLHQDTLLQSLWLMPLKQNFSDTYIDEFDIGIMVDL